jgi:hypothetical protein
VLCARAESRGAGVWLFVSRAMAGPYNVLFLCTGNSARSIMAEAILNRVGAGKFRAYSAGSHPKGQTHPEATRLLQSLGYDTSGFRSKSWSEFADPSAPLLDFVSDIHVASGQIGRGPLPALDVGSHGDDAPGVFFGLRWFHAPSLRVGSRNDVETATTSVTLTQDWSQHHHIVGRHEALDVFYCLKTSAAATPRQSPA